MRQTTITSNVKEMITTTEYSYITPTNENTHWVIWLFQSHGDVQQRNGFPRRVYERAIMENLSTCHCQLGILTASGYYF